MLTADSPPQGVSHDVSAARGAVEAYRRMARYAYALADANKANIDAYLALSNVGAAATRLALDAEGTATKGGSDAA